MVSLSGAGLNNSNVLKAADLFEAQSVFNIHDAKTVAGLQGKEQVRFKITFPESKTPDKEFVLFLSYNERRSQIVDYFKNVDEPIENIVIRQLPTPYGKPAFIFVDAYPVDDEEPE